MRYIDIDSVNYSDITRAYVNKQKEKNYVTIVSNDKTAGWFWMGDQVSGGVLSSAVLNIIIKNIIYLYDTYEVTLPTKYSELSTKTFSTDDFLLQEDFDIIVDSLNYLIAQGNRAGWLTDVEEYSYDSTYLSYEDINNLSLILNDVKEGKKTYSVTIPDHSYSDINFYYKTNENTEWVQVEEEQEIKGYQVQFKMEKISTSTTVLSSVYPLYRDVNDLKFTAENSVYFLTSESELSENEDTKIELISCGTAEYFVILPYNSYSSSITAYYDINDGNGWKRWFLRTTIKTSQIKFKLANENEGEAENAQYFTLSNTVSDLEFSSSTTNNYTLSSENSLDMSLTVAEATRYYVELPENSYSDLTCYYKKDNETTYSTWTTAKYISAFKVTFKLENSNSDVETSTEYNVTKRINDLALTISGNNFVFSSTLLGLSMTIANPGTRYYITLPNNPYVGIGEESLSCYYGINGIENTTSWTAETVISVSPGDTLTLIIQANGDPGISGAVPINQNLTDLEIFKEAYSNPPDYGYEYQIYSDTIGISAYCLYISKN